MAGDINLIKEINRLTRKGMQNMYLKVTIEENWRSQNFDILVIRRATTHVNTIEFLNFLLQLENQKFRSKTVCGFCIF